MQLEVAVNVALILAAWLAPIVGAFLKRRPWPAVVALIAPFILLWIVLQTFVACFGEYGGDYECNDDLVGDLVILTAVGVFVWVAVSALLPRATPQGPEDSDSAAARPSERSDHTLVRVGVAMVAVTVLLWAWSLTTPPSYSDPLKDDASSLAATGAAVVSFVVLILVTTRHRTKDADGPGRRWLVGAWVAAAVALVYVFAVWMYDYLPTLRISEASGLTAIALALACRGLFSDLGTPAR